MSLPSVVAELLATEPEGRSAADLAEALRAHEPAFRFVQSDQVERILARYPHEFVRAPDGRWQLVASAARAVSSEALDAAPEPDRGLGTEPTEFVVFDVEATSNDPDRAELLQIAAVRLDAELREIARFPERFVRYTGPLEPAVSKLTGIQPSDVENAEPPAEVLAEFVRFAEGAFLVAHNGSTFDGPLLARPLKECGLELRVEEVIDSLEAACIVLPREAARSLEALRERFGIITGSAHRAGADVDALVAVLRQFRQEIARFPLELREVLAKVLHPESGLAQLLGLCPPTLDAPEDRLGTLRPPASVALVDAGAAPRPRPAPDTGQTAALFGADGPLARASAAAGRSYEPREGQVAMATAVRQAFDAGQFAMIEAGTGTGKTLAYLLPAIQWVTEGGGPVAIATHTKLLQDQLLGELRFLDERADCLGARGRWTYAVRKGRRNYLCLYKLREAVRELSAGTPWIRRVALAMLCVWAWSGEQGTDDEVALGWLGQRAGGETARGALRGALCDDDCAEQHCPFYEPCCYFRSVRLAERADLVVVNHALLLTDRSVLERARHVVLDEAHELENAATDALTQEVAGEELKRLLDAVHRQESDRSGRRGSVGWRVRVARAFGLSLRDEAPTQLANAVAEAQAALDSASIAVHVYLDRYDHKRDDEARYGHVYPYAPVANTRPWLRTVETLRRLAERLEAAARAVETVAALIATRPLVDPHYSGIGLRSEGYALAQHLQASAGTLRALIDLDELSNRVYLLTAGVIGPLPREELEQAQRRPDWALRAPPIDVGPMLAEDLFGRLDAAVLTSATLTVDGSFAFLRRRLGLDPNWSKRVKEHLVPSPFDYKRQALLCLPGHLPAPRPAVMDEYLQRLGHELERYVTAFEGRTLALFTARAHLQCVTKALADRLQERGIALLAQDDGASPRTLVTHFKRNSRALLAGLRAFWQGVDIPGEDLSHVWITKLPFPNMGDPLLRARQQRLLDADRRANPFEDFFLPLTVLSFRQEFGRLIRSSIDRGVVVVADRRLRSSMYRDIFLGSLPAPAICEESDREMYRAIAQFLDWPLDETRLVGLPQSEADGIIAANRLTGDEDRATAAAKLHAALELFRLTSPPIEDFKRPQLEIMLDALEGDTLAILPTGAGKSLCFQLPALLRDRVTLVVSPLVALMKDQVDRLRRERGIHRARAIDHSVSAGEREEILQDVRDGRCRLLYLAPERLRDQGTIEWLRQVQVAQIVVDEAHCVSLWGPTFRPEFLRIRDVADRLGRPPILALTATAPPPDRDAIIQGLRLDLGQPARLHVGDFDRPNLRFAVRTLPRKADKDRELARILSAMQPGDTAIVYVARRREAERLAWLIQTNCQLTAQPYHAGLSGSQRASIQEAFVENGAEQLQVIVATNAFGMGVDKPDVRYVIHYDMPASLTAYYQEAGRAGRDGQPAYCVLLYWRGDCGIHEYLIRQSTPDRDKVREIYAYLLGERAGGRSRGVARRDQRVYVNPEVAAFELDIAPSTFRVVLHHLEEGGFLERTPYDYGARARIKLRSAPASALASLDLRDPEVELAHRATLHLGFHGADDQEFDTLDLASKLGVEPTSLEAALLRLARPPWERIVYRSWERSIILQLKPSTRSAEDFDVDLFKGQRKAAAERLEQMRQYALAKQCRRAILVKHLGGSFSRTNCGGCDVCAPDYPWPWASTAVPNISLDGGIDPAWEILRAVYLMDGKCTRTQLKMALRGQESYYRGGHSLRRDLLVADFFGRLQYVRERQYDAALDRLLRDALIVEQQTTWIFADKDTQKGTVLTLTESGRRAYESGCIPRDKVQRHQATS